MRGCAAIATALPAALAGCAGEQSALQPAGREAAELYHLFVWVLLPGAAAIWIALNGTFFYFTVLNRDRSPRRWGDRLILGGGIVFPTLGLIALLGYTLPIMAGLRPVEGPPQVRVHGEQWWWRVHYETPDGVVHSANELRLPVGRSTLIALGAENVIHSFWVPSLSGKLDMFPGRETLLPVEPVRTGVYRGQCAELCGDSHALMAFPAVVMEPAEFVAWLEAQATPAVPPANDQARRGEEIFFAEGCAACHAVRGTPADGRLGPDLTHIGSRLTIGAGTLPNTVETLALWIAETERIKPGVQMPSYGHLDAQALDDLAHYLEGLE